MPRPIIRKGAKFDPVEVKSITKVGKFERSIVIMNDKQKITLLSRSGGEKGLRGGGAGTP